MIDFLLGVPGKLKAISDYLTTHWTSGRAAKLDFITAGVATASSIGALSTYASGIGQPMSQRFTASGTFTPSAALLAKGGVVYVTMVGGGGAGGIGYSNVYGGQAGESGRSSISLPVSVTGAVAVVVGAGGVGAGAGSPGGAGLSSSFGLIKAGGGLGGAGAASSGTSSTAAAAPDSAAGMYPTGAANAIYGGASPWGEGGLRSTNAAAAANTGAGGGGHCPGSGWSAVGGAGGSGFVLVEWRE